MTEPTVPSLLQLSIPADLQRQVEDIQSKVPAVTGPPGDLDDERKRWLIVGICLHSIISPLLRKYVDHNITSLYSSLVSTDAIQTQGYSTYLKKYPATNKYSLNYESINNNNHLPKKNYHSYDYKVTSHVNLSKLFLQPNMARYSGFNESCDSSALLGIVINSSSFPSGVQTDAEKIRAFIRNPWAHCDFRDWTTSKYRDSFQAMIQLVKNLVLSNQEEKNILGDLNTWETTGQNFLSGTRLGLEIVGEIRQQTHVLSSYVQTLCSEADSQFIKVHTELTSMERIIMNIEERMRNLESDFKGLASAQASFVIEKKAEKKILDNALTQMLSTSAQLDTNISILRDEHEKYIEKGVQEKNELTQKIKSLGESMERMNIKDTILQKDVRECGEKLSNCEVKMYEKVDSIKNKLEKLHDFKQRLDSELARMKTIVTETKIKQEDFAKDVESFCKQIQDDITKREETKEALETFSNTLQKIKKDVESLNRKLELKDADHIPKNIRDQHQQEISEWEQDQTTFVKTRASHHILESLPLHNCIVVTGSSGCGKSSNIHHAALHLRDRFGFEIIPVLTGPTDIINYYYENKKQVFVVDDFCGKKTVNVNKLHDWKDFSEKMEKKFNVAEKDVARKTDITKMSCPKLLISCRLHIYKELRFHGNTLFTEKECNLVSFELCLLHNERVLMLQKYILDDIIANVEQVIDNFDYFPLLCQLSKDKKSDEVITLLTVPLKCIKNDINNIIDENNYHCCALVLCILFDGEFNTQWLDLRSAPENIKVKLKGIVTEFDIELEKERHRKYLKTGYSTLEGTFFKHVKQGGTEYRMIHDKIHEMAAVICGQQLPECFIKYAPPEIIRDHFIFESLTKDHEGDDSIVLSGDQEEHYFERLVCDLKDHVIESTFHNSQLSHQTFIDKLIPFLRKIDDAKTVLKKLDTQGCKIANTHSHKLITSFLPHYYATPLIDAAIKGYTDIVQFLIVNVKCNVNKTDGKGNSPLHKASERGYSSVAKLLLENNADISHCNKYGMSPLYVACEGGYKDTVELLLQANADISQCSRYGQSTLYVACQRGHRDVVELLLENKADVNQRDDDGISVLSATCKGGHKDVVELLLENKADVNQCDDDGRSVLYVACKEGHTDIVELLQQNNADVSLCSRYGQSPLFVACEGGHIYTVKLLLQNNAYVNQCDDDGISPLLMACNRGHTDIVELLIQNNPDVSICSRNGQSPLSAVCKGGHIDTVQLLLKQNAKVNQFDQNGISPLYVACEGGHTDIVELLIQNKADVSQCNRSGRSPLLIVCKGGHKDSVELLLQNNADVNQFDEDGISPLYVACEEGHTDIVELLIQNKADVYQCNRIGESSLYASCKGGHRDVVELLLHNKADVNQCIINGESPLFVSCVGGHKDVVQLLLQYNADVNQYEGDGISPLFVACEGGHKYTVELLLQNKADVSQCNYFNQSPLYVACREGHTDTVELLLQNGDDVNQCDAHGWSLLNVACEGGHTDTVKLLLENNADVSQCDRRGWSPMFVACVSGHKDVVKLLVQKNADVNQCVINGESPLYVACKGGHKEVVKLLLQNNADVNQCNKNGESPLYVACEGGHTETVELLLQNKADVSQCNNNGESPLHAVCSFLQHLCLIYGRGKLTKPETTFETVQLLLAWNADVQMRNDKGQTPLDIAYKSKLVQLVNLFEENLQPKTSPSK